MNDAARAPWWSASRAAVAAGIALSFVLLATLAGVGWFDRRQYVDAQVARANLLARVLDDHATRLFDGTSMALATLAERFNDVGDADALARMSPVLSQALVGLPFVRSIAVLDVQGRVVASSSPADVGVSIDLARLGRTPSPGEVRIGPRVNGRQIADLARPDGGRASPVAFIPVLRRQPTDLGGAFIVALVNPDAIASYHELALGGPADSAALVSYDRGVLSLAGGGATPAPAGGPVPAFEALRAGQEHGSYVGPGFGPGERLVSYRATRTWPLAVVVERSEEVVLGEWASTVQWIGVAGLLVLAFVVVMSWTASRSLRLREAARRERDEAKTRVAASERELSVVVKSVQELIFRTDAGGVLTFVNARWPEVLGQAADEALGSPLRALVGPDQQSEIDRMLSLSDPAELRTAQVSVQDRHGGLRRFHVAVSPLVDGPSVLGFVGSAVDVTERWLAQQSLQAQLAFTELLLEISPLPVSMTGADGTLVTVNRAWEDFVGRPRSEVLGQPESRWLADVRASSDAAEDARLLQRGRPVRRELQVVHGDQSLRDVVITKVLVPGEAGAPAGVLSTMMDVSEFREAERATREARDVAEDASRAKSEFIANISHELRTPLQSILGFSELGLKRASENARLASMFQDIHGSGTRMLALVNDLLDVSKIESTVGMLHLEAVDVRALARAVGRELEPLMQPRGLHLLVSLGDTPLVARVDPLRFQQVVRNVLANAVKFSPDGQAISMAAELSDTGDIHLRICDRGPGIPPAEIDSIFEAFVQSSATKDGAGGTGLGLAISRKIVTALGGHVFAENLPGGGAAFHIVLPSRAETAPAAL